jgi:hypothetical protein
MKKISLVLLCVLLIFACSSHEDPNADYSKLLAYSYASNFAKNKLKDPNSAEFASSVEKLEHTKHLGNWEYQINSYVLATNSFGAKIKTSFSCKIKIDKENDSFQLIDLRLE